LPNESGPPFEPVEWCGDRLRILDQTLLPGKVRYREALDAATVAEAIRRLAVRGAPLIGIAAAYGLALEARRGGDVQRAGELLAATRPTAMNLRWAIDRVQRAPDAEAEALRIHDEQRAADVRMSEIGAALVADGATLLTHCNTGALATGGIGTALGVIKRAHRQGKRIQVLVDETRPLLQGSRLTSWELRQEGIAFDVIADSAATGIISRGDVQAIFVGADRIASNGDTANKVGTYGLALAARAHDVPLYVVAPVSTIDHGTANGNAIVIEDRDPEEVLSFGGVSVAPEGATALNPAFDVTPAEYITAIVTERGMLRMPFREAIAAVGEKQVVGR
jgi:methylthioribose-1-phosphate isomerase